MPACMLECCRRLLLSASAASGYCLWWHQCLPSVLLYQLLSAQSGGVAIDLLGGSVVRVRDGGGPGCGVAVPACIDCLTFPQQLTQGTCWAEHKRYGRA